MDSFSSWNGSSRIALTDVVRVEVSAPYYNDRVRVEHEYGLTDSSGLPSTTRDEVIKR